MRFDYLIYIFRLKKISLIKKSLFYIALCMVVFKQKSKFKNEGNYEFHYSYKMFTITSGSLYKYTIIQ